MSKPLDALLNRPIKQGSDFFFDFVSDLSNVLYRFAFRVFNSPIYCMHQRALMQLTVETSSAPLFFLLLVLKNTSINVIIAKIAYSQELCGGQSLGEMAYFITLKKAPKIKQMKGLETTILTGLHGEKMMMVLSATLPGHSVPLHSHPHEQIGMVYNGKAVLRIGDEEKRVKKGDFYRIPANVPHGDTCIGEKTFVMLDIFCPVREDFVRKLKEQAHV